jgi:hypothetical protein
VAGLQFVYGVASLAALYFLLWRDLFNQLLVISLVRTMLRHPKLFPPSREHLTRTVCRMQGGMSALFAIGGYAIHAHRWVTIKVVRSASCLSTFDGG